MTMEDDEWKKLSLDDRCMHKLWKARVNGYEEVTKLFRQIDDEKSPEFAKYSGLIKKFVVDSNAMGQEKGLEAALAFVENYAHAGKTVNDVMAGVVTKCMAASKTKTRELALQITLMYVEIEKFDAVLEELLKGMDQKNPKIVAACVTATTTALKEFGVKIINIKPIIKKIPTLFADRDKSVRDEARLLAVEVYRWIGPAFKSHLNALQPVQVAELEVEFGKMAGGQAVPARYVRSQQEKQAEIAAAGEEAQDTAEEDIGDCGQVLDPYDIADPVDVLSKLPKNFYEQLEAKKWQERKEALESLENLLKTPKLENGDYGDLIRALKKIIQKDTNVIVVALSGKCLTGLANGLKKRFQQYATFCIPALLEKFKEKKQNVVLAIRDAIDAAYISVTIEQILDDVLEALNNKNPSVKSETALFLARAFTKTPATFLNKKLLKAYTGALIKNINEPDPGVRDSSSEALGTLMKLVGEKAVGPFIADLQKDTFKMTKIKECSDKAVIIAKSVPTKKEKKAVIGKSMSTTAVKQNAVVPKATATKRPATSTSSSRKKPAVTISSGSATIVKSKSSKTVNEKPRERDLSDEEAIDMISDILKAEVINGLSDSNWKNRVAAMEEFSAQVQMIEASSAPTQALLRTLSKRPGLKDTNFQVLKARLDVVKYLAENCPFSTTCADICLNDVTEKLGDSKNGTIASDVLTAIAEATKLEYVANSIIDFAFTQKSPKVLQESLLWLANAIKEFGFGNLNAKLFIENAKKALASSNPGVRTATITFLGTLYLYMGSSLTMFFENEKPTLRDQINAEFEKYENEKPPLPIRGVINPASSTDTLDQDDDTTEYASCESSHAQDLLPRVDISLHITESLIDEISDKNWKVRNEALTKVSNIITEAKLIKPNIGDLPQALALRLVDSNGKIAQTALSICESIAAAMGQPCRQYVRVFLPGFLQGLGDSKAWIRAASITCLNTWGELCAYKEFFEGEMIADALKTGSPTLRIELWMWLSEKLPKIKSVPKEELIACIPHLYSNLEDRNADVRKNAQEAVLGLMIHLSYETMVKQTDKLKPGSKTVVMAALDKARPNLPVKSLPKIKSAPVPEEKSGKGTKLTTSKNPAKSKASVGGTAKPSSARKKDEDIDTSPLVSINNMKHQRTIDENKLRVLKWNFTQPREEFVELLKEQMIAANINRTLIANMFHSDFRCHIKAIDSLMEDLPGNGPALISNLDLILKWLTLRFFDTNPSVLLKALEYLHNLFNMLMEQKYHMLENEGSAFIPYLVLKAGDPKDTVRNGVRSLFRQISNVFAVSRLFFYVMEGLKSKNARQRAECLEVMGSLIEDFGMNVCLPSPAVCLKEVAKQISDRDNVVRNAALNCIVQAYFIVGEKALKMVGQIAEKDMSLLEERIKRAKRPQPKASRLEPSPTNINNSLPGDNDLNSVQDTEETNGHSEDDENGEENDIPGIIIQHKIQEELKEYSGPFKLDPEVIKELDRWKPVVSKPKLQEFDLDFLKEDIVVPSLSDARAKVMPMSPPKPILPNQPITRSSFGLQSAPRMIKDVMLEKTITSMGFSDVTVALKGIEQMVDILQSNKGSSLVDYEDLFMTSLATQLKHLQSEDPKTNPAILKLYRSILTVIDAFYSCKGLGQKVSVNVLKDVLNQLIMLLVEAKLENCPNGETYIRVVNLHCVKIIERSNHTNIICALIKLLHDSVSNDGSTRLTDLIMKCLWRVIKIMHSWGEEIEYEDVLYETHVFLKDFPSSWWKSKQVDTPVRTIKTILHSMAKLKGSQLMVHLGKIPNTNDSELESYILRLLKSLKLEEVKQVPLKSEKIEPRKTLSRSMHTMLTEIFQKIGNKEASKEGFNLLYDFMRQHPDEDINQFLQKSSPVFQDYISNGLKNVELTRKAVPAAHETDENFECEAISGPDGDSRGAQYWNDRLDMWKKLWKEQTSRLKQ